MSHFTCLVVIGEAPSEKDAEARAENMLAPFSEELQVESYRDYENGAPEDFWAYSTLREESGLPEHPTWQEVVAVWNTRYGNEEPMHYDAQTGRAYRMSTYNPDSKWDWYVLGGRWRGFYPVRPGVVFDTRTQVGEPGSGGNPATPGNLDLLLKGDVDMDFLRRQNEIEAEEFWAKVEEAVAGCDLTAYRTWAQVRDEDCAGDITAARTTFGQQPVVVALRASGDLGWVEPDSLHLSADDPKAAYVAGEIDGSGTTFAVLDSEGWHEQGRMGWFGMVADEKDDRDWHAAWREMWNNLPDTTWVAVYDLHI